MARFLRNPLAREGLISTRRLGMSGGKTSAAFGLALLISFPVLGHQGHGHADAKQSATDGKGAVASFRRGSSRWGANYFPNVSLTTHEGKTVRFFDDLLKDKVVTINLIYTECKDSCPLATAQLAKVQQLLGDRVGRDVFMYTISIDPDRDTPKALRAHMDKFRVGPGWTFLTGKEEDVLLLRRKLGFLFEGIQTDIKDHNGAVLIGNQRTGQWMKRSPMDNPYFLAEQIGTWLTNWKAPSRYAKNNYANAPELRVPSMGENLFRSRCSACHTIGGDGRTVGGGEHVEKDLHKTGPDLVGVTRKRDPTWLARWIVNPAGMLAEKDPVAMGLYAEYGNVIMPNFHLGPVEVNALIEYMASESLRVERAAARLAARERAARPPSSEPLRRNP